MIVSTASAKANRPAQARGRGKAALRLWLRLLSCEDLAEQQIRSRLRTECGVTLPQFDVMSVLEHAGRSSRSSGPGAWALSPVSPKTR